MEVSFLVGRVVERERERERGGDTFGCMKDTLAKRFAF